MNKYEEALAKLADIDLQEYGKDGLDPFNDTPLGPLYACDCYREEFETLLELVDKQEFYRWHDLRKNPKDLPIENIEVLLQLENSVFKYHTGVLLNNSWHTLTGKIINQTHVLAWKFIERFENE